MSRSAPSLEPPASDASLVMHKGKAEPMQTSTSENPFSTQALQPKPKKRGGGFKKKVEGAGERVDDTLARIDEVERTGYMPTCTPIMDALKAKILGELEKVRAEMAKEMKQVTYLTDTLEKRVKVQNENGKIKGCQNESNIKLLKRVQADVYALKTELEG